MTERREIVAIVLARGGSKAIPKKNLVPIGGRPLIEHTLERAKSTQAITKVVVSTDSKEIAEVSESLGVDIVWRPTELCTDTSSSESGLIHCLDQLADSEGFEPDLVVFLQPTSPIRSSRHIEYALAAFDNEDADSLFSAGPLIGLAWKLERDAVIPVGYDPQNRRRRQDAPDYIAENGSIYIFKPWVLRDLKCRLGGKIVPFRMGAMDSFEVDEPDDIEIVDFLLRRRYPDLVKEDE